VSFLAQRVFSSRSTLQRSDHTNLNRGRSIGNIRENNSLYSGIYRVSIVRHLSNSLKQPAINPENIKRDNQKLIRYIKLAVNNWKIITVLPLLVIAVLFAIYLKRSSDAKNLMENAINLFNEGEFEKANEIVDTVISLTASHEDEELFFKSDLHNISQAAYMLKIDFLTKKLLTNRHDKTITDTDKVHLIRHLIGEINNCLKHIENQKVRLPLKIMFAAASIFDGISDGQEFIKDGFNDDVPDIYKRCQKILLKAVTVTNESKQYELCEQLLKEIDNIQNSGFLVHDHYFHLMFIKSLKVPLLQKLARFKELHDLYKEIIFMLEDPRLPTKALRQEFSNIKPQLGMLAKLEEAKGLTKSKNQYDKYKAISIYDEICKQNNVLSHEIVFHSRVRKAALVIQLSLSDGQKLFDEIIAEYPKSSEAYSKKGKALVSEITKDKIRDDKIFQAAHEALDKALEFDENNISAEMQKAILFKEQNETEKARNICSKYEQKSPRARSLLIKIDRENPENIEKKISKAITTEREYALMSMQVYSQGSENKDLKDLGWHELINSNRPELKLNRDNFHGSAYVNDVRKEIVIAYRGAEFSEKTWWNPFNLFSYKGSLQANMKLWLFDQIDKQYALAAVFDNKVREYALKDKKKDYVIYYTGHELGAALAEVVAWSRSLIERKKTNTLKKVQVITFNSPGTVEIITKMMRDESNFTDVELTTYLSEPNIFNTCKRHFGKVIRLFPQPKSTSGITSIVSAFDKATGLPFNKNGKTLDIVKVNDWPQGLLDFNSIEDFKQRGLDINNTSLMSDEDKFLLQFGAHYVTEKSEQFEGNKDEFPEHVWAFLIRYTNEPDKGNASSYGMDNSIINSYSIINDTLYLSADASWSFNEFKRYVCKHVPTPSNSEMNQSMKISFT
jgi:hypothetical protein